MSQYFDLGDQTLWNPSNGASRLFLRQVAVFEAELDLPSGIGPMQDDQCQIDPTAFHAFAEALLVRHRRTSHAVMIALSDGFVATVLVLAERAGIEVDWSPAEPTTQDGPTDVQVPVPPSAATAAAEARPATLRQKSRELERFMAW
ncbi:DUF6086 family protein [Streptomyces sp. NPDC048483]|uniref:DUF6086 family protein n=1 Tax=Streptomyces sp. NPDC048483 TaxID=3154927 RepID=UPI00341E0019